MPSVFSTFYEGINIDGMILDPRLPDIDGINVLRQTKDLYPHIKVVILSGHASDLDFRI